MTVCDTQSSPVTKEGRKEKEERKENEGRRKKEGKGGRKERRKDG